MIYRHKKSRKYQSPWAKTSSLALERNFCQSIRFKTQVDPLENMNYPDNPIADSNGESFYFES